MRLGNRQMSSKYPNALSLPTEQCHLIVVSSCFPQFDIPSEANNRTHARKTHRCAQGNS